MAQGYCELCGKFNAKLELMLYYNAENKYLCPTCWDREATRGDMEAERQREENDQN